MRSRELLTRMTAPRAVCDNLKAAEHRERACEASTYRCRLEAECV